MVSFKYITLVTDQRCYLAMKQFESSQCFTHYVYCLSENFGILQHIYERSILFVGVVIALDYCFRCDRFESE